MASRDPKGLELLYDRYNRLVFSLILRIVRLRQDAEDVLMEVFWQAWQQAGRYDKSRGTPLAWLLTIARTRAIDSVRASGRRTATVIETADLPEGRSDPGPDPFVLAGTRQAVLKCLKELSDAQRTALELAYFEGMSHTEIATRLGQPLGTMKDRIRTAMIHLKKCLRPYGGSA
jgi:RNA polymerase sigma-70 factor (ECF subfamily)